MGNGKFHLKRWTASVACFFIPALILIGHHMAGEDTVDLLAMMQQVQAPQVSAEQMLLAYDPTGVRPPAQPVPPRGLPAPRPTIQIAHRPVVVTEQVIRPAPPPPLLSPMGSPVRRP